MAEPARVPTVDVVVPAYNEVEVLRRTVTRLQAHLASTLDVPFVLTIAESGSTDGTDLLAAELAERLDGVRAVCDEQRGRGLAVRRAWESSDGDVVAYVDADLSIGLDAFGPLLAPLLAGTADLAVGSRHVRGARVRRSLHRAVLSRSLNLLLRVVLRTRFSDAQCGFKAARRDVVLGVMDDVQADHWFFDTELLVVAQEQGLRIHEVPVHCVDDPRSSVDLVPTVRSFLRDVVRLARARRDRAAGPPPATAARPARHRTSGEVYVPPVT